MNARPTPVCRRHARIANFYRVRVDCAATHPERPSQNINLATPFNPMNPRNTSRKIPLVLAIAVVTGAALWQLSERAGLDRWADARERQILLATYVNPDEYTLRPPGRDTADKHDVPRLAVLTADRLTLEDYPVVADRWSDALAARAPASGFTAYYLTTGDPRVIDARKAATRDDAPPSRHRPLAVEAFASRWRDEPERLIATENVATIDIHYRYNAFKGIPAQDFAACWMGTLRIDEGGDYRITPQAGKGQLRLLLNRHRISSGAPVTLRLTPGDYTLEAEYRNDWYTADFSLHIDKVAP